MTIYTAPCKSTKCYLLESSEGLLLFDAGWPNEYRDFWDHLKAIGLSVKDIKSFIVSHFHIDHAGLAGLLMKNGASFIVFENQVNYIDEMEALIARKNYAYEPIDKGALRALKLAESREWLKSIGVEGEVVQQFGHGDQCLSLLLDTGDALIGDLPPEENLGELVAADWEKLRSLGVKRAFPAHAPYIELS